MTRAKDRPETGKEGERVILYIKQLRVASTKLTGVPLKLSNNPTQPIGFGTYGSKSGEVVKTL